MQNFLKFENHPAWGGHNKKKHSKKKEDKEKKIKTGGRFFRRLFWSSLRYRNAAVQ